MKNYKKMSKKERKEAQYVILNKYFTIENKIADVSLEFHSFEELLDEHFVGVHTGKMNSVLFDKIDEIFDLLPSDVKVKLHIKFEETNGYTLEEMNQILTDNLQLKIYSLVLETLKTSKNSWILLLVGAFLLVFSYFLSSQFPQVVTDIVNISGTLMVWESVGDKILESSKNTRYARRYLVRILEFNIEEETKKELQTE